MSSVVERAEEFERRQILLLENKIVTQSVLYSSGAWDPTEQAAWTKAYRSDVAATIARRWVLNEKVDAIVDVPNSAAALAVNAIARAQNKVLLVSGSVTNELTGKECSPNIVHWTIDTWALANGTGRAIVNSGGDSWFFLASDFAGGRAPEQGIHDLYLFTVKSPSKSRYPWDYYRQLSTIPAAAASKPLSAGGCPLPMSE